MDYGRSQGVNCNRGLRQKGQKKNNRYGKGGDIRQEWGEGGNTTEKWEKEAGRQVLNREIIKQIIENTMTEMHPWP